MGAVTSEDRGLVRVVTLSNPQKRNALDFESLLELEEACLAAARDRVRCLVLRGAGERAFSAGFDIGALPRSGGAGERPDEAVERAMEAVEAVPCPTVAFVNGAAYGAGAELAVTCDLRVAAHGASLGMPPARLGVVYSAAGLRRFLSLLGPARTRELFFTGRAVKAEEALALGLVDRVFPAAEAEAAALALAGEIGRNAPLAVQGMKHILRLLESAHERGLTDAEREEVAGLRRRAFESADLAEGRAAFLEKRPPRFSGS
ncbi:MAG TPA: enoyl-CoA hydratase-related protein [Anaeromyxobacteraceae bacterium]|jgi:enoyl-CoA hydratase/carnithine racemase|nr:enoyl-CoA hydratase-related protein [Anaeromyxobacteraceae bacterium]